MRFQQLIYITATLLASTALATPVLSFSDIERRWSNGESEAQIHANQHIREATPAWPLARDADANADHDFAHALDERTLAASRKRAAERLRRREDDSNNSSGGELMAKIKQFVVAFMRSKGQGDKVVGLRSVDVDEAPVLKPKRTMRYYFSS